MVKIYLQQLVDLQKSFEVNFKDFPLLIKLIRLVFTYLSALVIVRTEKIQSEEFSFVNFDLVIFKFLISILKILDYYAPFFFFLSQVFYCFRLLRQIIRLLVNFWLLLCKGLYFFLRWPFQLYYAWAFVRFRDREELYERSYPKLVETIVGEFLDSFYYSAEDRMEEYEETILYGPPKAERELWFRHSYEYLAAQKRLAAFFSTRLTDVRWDRNLRYNYFTWFTSLDPDLRAEAIQRVIIGVKDAWVQRKKALSSILRLEQKYTAMGNLIFLEFFLVYVSFFIESSFSFLRPVISFFLSIVSFLFNTYIHIFSLVNYIGNLWFQVMLTDIFNLFFLLPLRCLYLLLYAIVFQAGLYPFSRFANKFLIESSLIILSKTFSRYFWQFNVYKKKLAEVSGYSIKEVYLGKKDILLFLSALGLFGRDYRETITLYEMDEYYVEVARLFTKYVYVKRVLINFCLSFLTEIWAFFESKIYGSKLFFIFLPVLYFCFCFLRFIYHVFVISLLLIKTTGLFFIKFVLYVWFDLGTRLALSWYTKCWTLSMASVERGSLIYSVLLNYFFPFLLDAIRLVVKSVLVFSAFFCFWFYFSDVIILFLKAYPKWYKYYLITLYVVYFIIGALFSILSRKFREVFIEGVDYIIENFFTIIFSINVLNYFMIPLNYQPYWTYIRSPSRWDFTWIRGGKHFRPWKHRRRGLFSIRDYFDKGPWQIHSDRRYIPLWVLELLEDPNITISDKKSLHPRSKRHKKL